MLHHTGFEIHQREDQGIVILDLRGKLEMGTGDIALREFVEGLFSGGNRQLILGLAQISVIDSAGSGALLLLAQQYQAGGGKLVLFHVDQIHVEVYELARLEVAIEIYPVELDAVNSFFPDRKVAHYDILDYVETQENPKHEK